ncbi:hypothetical protein SUGI_1179850 [Cryptomeria japonica]|nr:hypothetical protein SUGI_1179850 [Cryptomeria japonica]
MEVKAMLMKMMALEMCFSVSAEVVCGAFGLGVRGAQGFLVSLHPSPSALIAVLAAWGYLWGAAFGVLFVFGMGSAEGCSGGVMVTSRPLLVVFLLLCSKVLVLVLQQLRGFGSLSPCFY